MSISLVDILEISDEDVAGVADTEAPGVSSSDVKRHLVTLVTIIHLHLPYPVTNLREPIRDQYLLSLTNQRSVFTLTFS